MVTVHRQTQESLVVESTVVWLLTGPSPSDHPRAQHQGESLGYQGCTQRYCFKQDVKCASKSPRHFVGRHSADASVLMLSMSPHRDIKCQRRCDRPTSLCHRDSVQRASWAGLVSRFGSIMLILDGSECWSHINCSCTMYSRSHYIFSTLYVRLHLL
jgi:hypothetical protein